jgi:hypothetical protein
MGLDAMAQVVGGAAQTYTAVDQSLTCPAQPATGPR